jgi:hypothetical protein
MPFADLQELMRDTKARAVESGVVITTAVQRHGPADNVKKGRYVTSAEAARITEEACAILNGSSGVHHAAPYTYPRSKDSTAEESWGLYVSFSPGEETQYDFMDIVYAMTEPVEQLPRMLRNFDANLVMDAPHNIIVIERLKRGY